MKYTVCRSFEWLYPDIYEYKTASDRAVFSACAGGFAAFQIFLTGICGETVTVSCDGAELYEEIAIPVEANAGLERESEHFPERKAPFEVYDCLKPYGGEIRSVRGVAAVYVALKVPCGVKELSGTVEIRDGAETVFVHYNITVKGSLPRETLKIVMGLNLHDIKKYHGVQSREEYLELETKYLAMLRRQHQNRLYVNAPFPDINGDEEPIYDEFDRYVEKALSMGFNAFHLGGVGFRRSWDSHEILVMGMDSREKQARAFLKRHLSALRNHLKEKGWLEGDMFTIGIADEPNEYNAETYKELARFVREIIPEIKLYDAVSAAPIDGALDIWIPRSDEYENNREIFEKRRKAGGEIWQYVCLFPRDGYINRFMDIPLLSTRYIYWGNYLYDLDGYLHWTVNDYQSDCDPFKISCPAHLNADKLSILPPGDDKLIYPGEREPWMSIRLENQRESAEEYEMLQLIARKDKSAADSLCRRGLRKFSEAQYDPCEFARLLEDLYSEYGKI